MQNSDQYVMVKDGLQVLLCSFVPLANESYFLIGQNQFCDLVSKLVYPSPLNQVLTSFQKHIILSHNTERHESLFLFHLNLHTVNLL